MTTTMTSTTSTAAAPPTMAPTGVAATGPTVSAQPEGDTVRMGHVTTTNPDRARKAKLISGFPLRLTNKIP